MARGQAEALVPMLEEILAAKDLVWRDLDAIGVCIGPGNFTGIRISVSLARGLALSLAIPAVGVSAFEIMRFASNSKASPVELVSLPAPRDMAYVQRFDDGVAEGGPRVIDPSELPHDLDLPANAHVCGHRAEDIARGVGATWDDRERAQVGGRIALLAAAKLRDGMQPPRPSPLYVRAADAAPSSDLPPVMLP